MNIIYEPKGKAREYAPLACNLYTGCSHGCLYCFGPSALRKTKEEFHNNIQPKKNALVRLVKDADKLARAGDDREILLSFVTDPYQPIERQEKITRRAIEILKDFGLHFTILTKGGELAMRDFELLEGYDKCSFGVTLTFDIPSDSKRWEPNADRPAMRILALMVAHTRGIKTWVSMEPVISPKQSLALIESFYESVDHWKIGKLNYFPEIEKKVDWVKFREDARTLLDSLGADYYFKKSLTEL